MQTTADAQSLRRVSVHLLDDGVVAGTTVSADSQRERVAARSCLVLAPHIPRELGHMHLQKGDSGKNLNWVSHKAWHVHVGLGTKHDVRAAALVHQRTSSSETGHHLREGASIAKVGGSPRYVVAAFR